VSGPVERDTYRLWAGRRTLAALQERRPNLIANSAGRNGPVAYPDLTPDQQSLFEQQLAAYRTALHLIRACDTALLTGLPVHADLAVKWLAARNSWRLMRDTR
jgi:hypothetical protein